MSVGLTSTYWQGCFLSFLIYKQDEQGCCLLMLSIHAFLFFLPWAVCVFGFKPKVFLLVFCDRFHSPLAVIDPLSNLARSHLIKDDTRYLSISGGMVCTIVLLTGTSHPRVHQPCRLSRRRDRIRHLSAVLWAMNSRTDARQVICAFS